MIQPEKPHSILVVEDNQVNLRIIGTTLEAAGYDVGFALNGEQAIDLLQAGADYDLVLLDVNMPVMNGFDCCTLIRKNDALKDLPVIFLTAYNDMNHLLKGFEVGGQDYVTKPFQPQELLSRVRTHVELKMAKDRLTSVNQWLEAEVAERTKELNRANAELEEANRKLTLLDERKNDFLHLIGHEIRTPLTGVVGLTDCLLEELRDTEHVETIEQLGFSVRRLETFAMSAILITDFRNNNVLLQFDEHPVSRLLTSAVDRAGRAADQKNVTLHMTDGSAGTRIRCDARLAGMALDSILDNAVKFSPRGGTVDVIVRLIPGSVTITIRDRGRGFTDRALDHLFDLFEVGEQHTDQSRGMGLALTRRIIDAHDGTIEAGNEPQGGARVTLTLAAM